MTGTNIPQVELDNLFLQDPLGEPFFRRLIGAEAFASVRGRFVEMGERGARATPLSARADKQSPVLQTHDARGERVDRVVYHPDYHQLEELAYGGGIVGIKYDPQFLARHKANRHLVGFGAGYYFAQTELGLYCPICMTDGVGRVLERHAPGQLATETIAHLAATDRSELWQGAMFLTEKQGGSDVGANTVQARQQDGRWLLRGDKWFCSNVDAEAILALARMPGGPEGTKGLGLFLVLRHVPAGNGATIRIHRLKDKLGVRSMPSGEVTLEDAEGHLIGGVGQGFKMMAEMLNMSRMYNAVASMAGMRRGILEALAYGSERRAFGSRLWELPIWRASMADLQAEFMGCLALTFEAVRALDRADQGDGASSRLVRLLTPIAKALTGKAALFGISESMEAIGGNGYIEESILPRLLRDCQVLPIWEGTTNILMLDAMRAIRKEQSHEALFARVQEALGAPGADAGDCDHVLQRVKADQAALAALGQAQGAAQERGARGWVESAGRTLALALLVEAGAEPALSEACRAAVRRLRARPFATAPLGAVQATALQDTEEVLLRAGFDDRRHKRPSAESANH